MKALLRLLPKIACGSWADSAVLKDPGAISADLQDCGQCYLVDETLTPAPNCVPPSYTLTTAQE